MNQLPTEVRELARRLGVGEKSTTTCVRLRQWGRMRPERSSRWTTFSARQSISTLDCCFDWRAHAGPFGMVLERDTLNEKGGQTGLSALGFIPILSVPDSTTLQRGQLIRYLAELPWAPEAILRNPCLRWRVQQPDLLVVGAGSGEVEAEVTLRLDEQGRVSSVSATDRPRWASHPYLPAAWRGSFSDYRNRNGLWLPLKGEATWETEGKPFVYWQAHIEERESTDGSVPVPSRLAGRMMGRAIAKLRA